MRLYGKNNDLRQGHGRLGQQQLLPSLDNMWGFWHMFGVLQTFIHPFTLGDRCIAKGELIVMVLEGLHLLLCGTLKSLHNPPLQTTLHFVQHYNSQYQ